MKIRQNTEKSPEDLKRLAVTQTPMKDDKQPLVWKTSNVYITTTTTTNNNNEESRLFRLKMYWDRSEYWVESRNPAEIRCHSDFNESRQATTGVKNSQ